MIVLFDGVCNICNRLVNFIIAKDKNNLFKFASLQSGTADKIIKKFCPEQNKIYSVLLIENEKFYKNSTAILRIFKNISGLWKLFYIFIIVPPFIRDAVYNVIAKKRYLWFGKKDRCMVPDDKIIQKFLI